MCLVGFCPVGHETCMQVQVPFPNRGRRLLILGCGPVPAADVMKEVGTERRREEWRESGSSVERDGRGRVSCDEECSCTRTVYRA